jgi:pilus assembly protein CpaC
VTNKGKGFRTALVLGAGVACAFAAPAWSQAPASTAAPMAVSSEAVDLVVPLYKSRTLTLPVAAGRVSVGNPDVADIVVIRPTEVYVVGRDIGSTNVLLWDRDNRLIRSLNVEVSHDLEGLKARLHQLLPGDQVEVRSAQRSIVLSGRVADASRMSTAVTLAEAYLAQAQNRQQAQADGAKDRTGEASPPQKQGPAGQVINLLQVSGAQQVMLEVKVAEISRSELKRMNAQFNSILRGGKWSYGGVNGGATFPDAVFKPGDVRLPVFGDGGKAPWGPAIDEFAPNPMGIQNQGLFLSFLSSDFLFNLALDVAKENGLAKILAEPTLTTLTGQEAQFLSGGEFPIPVPQGNETITIEFKEFGVGLRFVPVVLNDGQINLKLNISVSEILSGNSVAVSTSDASSTFVVPSLSKRAASATVELGDGETIAIAGLINENLRELVTKFPGLGDLPVLGALFRSQEFVKGQTELVILVTPRLAKPLPPDRIRLPTDGFVEPTDAEFYLLGRMEGAGSSAGGAK